MDEYNKHAALADTIKIEDITSCTRKQSILQRLKDNDESFDKLWICYRDQIEDHRDYSPDSDKELAWLGYFLGQNTNIKELYIPSDLGLFNDSGRDVFRKGLGNNKSIQEMVLRGFDLHAGQMLRMLDQFLKNNNNLSEIKIEDCPAGAEGVRQLSLAIGDCNQSLKQFSLQDNDMEDGQLVDIITALSMHPQLTELCLVNNGTNMGRNECTALSTLLRCTTTQLKALNLDNNDIDDEGVEVLASALVNLNQLQELNLDSNSSITIKGWRAVASLLELSSSSLKSLDVSFNDIGNEEVMVFVNALANNSTLKELDMQHCDITEEGWSPFSRLLCDNSSVNNTYLSNHTIEHIRGTTDAHVNKYLVLNKREDKQQVAMTKILQNHSYFDMQSFFEWEFKVLPLMIDWFVNAARRVTTYDQKISRLRLSATFDFIKEFPMLYIEPVTRQEIAEYTAMEEQLLQGGKVGSAPGQLEDIRQRKARAMRRL